MSFSRQWVNSLGHRAAAKGQGTAEALVDLSPAVGSVSGQPHRLQQTASPIDMAPWNRQNTGMGKRSVVFQGREGVKWKQATHGMLTVKERSARAADT